ncbi:MAG: molybdopterin-dependent oxidoreductase [Abitibacteriaceae bacterium]|nr:molybdopterin-dependent oxidoreductase [Abditibacteriaceae bacterium]MBV9868584.1 molybdopterin-dependent oxidoreductase [Abditibacteriaceae bacterium]
MTTNEPIKEPVDATEAGRAAKSRGAAMPVQDAEDGAVHTATNAAPPHTPEAAPAPSAPVPIAATPGIPVMAKAGDDEIEGQMHQMSRRSFLWAAVAIGAGFTTRQWLITRRPDNGIPWPFRRVLETNEQLARDYFKTARLVPNFAVAKADPDPRTNGDIGLGEDFDPDTWKLTVEGLADKNAPTRTLTLKDIKALPKVEMVTELKCIEGWSIIVHWAGARFADFMEKYPPATQSGETPDVKHKPNDLANYVSLQTPDKAYYVGLEMESALHPQTLLCYEINGEPLTPEHGAPLRLAIPVKYGVKNIKRIGKISFTNQRPADYWAEQGYDWYAGH